MKVAARLMAVKRIIRSVHVKHDAFRRLRVKLEKGFRKRVFDVALPSDDLLVSTFLMRPYGRQLLSLQSTFASKCESLLRRRAGLAR